MARDREVFLLYSHYSSFAPLPKDHHSQPLFFRAQWVSLYLIQTCSQFMNSLMSWPCVHLCMPWKTVGTEWMTKQTPMGCFRLVLPGQCDQRPHIGQGLHLEYYRHVPPWTCCWNLCSWFFTSFPAFDLNNVLWIIPDI